jgi:hypothetical protein
MCEDNGDILVEEWKRRALLYMNKVQTFLEKSWVFEESKYKRSLRER